MALFADIEPDPQPQRRRSGTVGWVLLAVAVVGVTLVALVPAPYVIEKPGPVYDTLGQVSIGGEDVPLIDIPDEKTYPTAGSLDMLTVSVTGDREHLPSWFEVATAYFDPSLAVVPVDSIYPAGVTVEQSNQQGAVDMANSQKEAVAAALTSLGYEFPSKLTVVSTEQGFPAEGILETSDVILTVNGESFADVTGLRAEIATNGVDKPAVVEIERAGRPLTVEVTPVLSDAGVAIFGISVGGDYEFPFQVKIQLENVGGPSAGQMFALGIIDKLTPGELNGGEDVAGTGTITATGDVGAIGGIRQKLYGARDAGADWFLAPESNCNEVTGHIPAGLTVFAVTTLDDSLAALEAIASGADTSDLPTCPAG